MSPNAQLSLGTKIRSARLELQITLRSFAAEMGISASQLSSIEQDRVVPTSELIQHIAIKLNLDPDALCGLAGKLTPEAQQTLSRIARTDPFFFRRMVERIGGG